MKIKFLLFILAIALLSCGKKSQTPIKIDIGGKWKFLNQDSMAFASPNFDDSKWDTIGVRNFWEYQGYDLYDGFAWYRKSFFLSSDLKKSSFLKDSIQIVLGIIDDTEQTYLNGVLIGENGTVVSTDYLGTDSFINNKEAYKVSRKYVLSVNDPRIKWDSENVIAIRVHDHYLGGGVLGPDQFVAIVDIPDYVSLDADSFGFVYSGDSIRKNIVVRNSFPGSLSGVISIELINMETGSLMLQSKQDISIDENAIKVVEFNFLFAMKERTNIVYKFDEKKSGIIISSFQELPYILTPKVSDKPRINGARIYGQRPNKPFLYKIPATGKKPLIFTVKNLPIGLSVDSLTGIIIGKVKEKGTYKVQVEVKNDVGIANKEITLEIGDKLSLTPPMGWNSWNCWGLSVSQEKVVSTIDHFVAKGLVDHGWTYVNIDDGWEAASRDKNGILNSNEKFPNMKELADYAHSKGLKLGIYSSPGTLTCGGYLGSYQYEKIDASTFADWGIDYLKHDWCSYSQIATKVPTGFYQYDWLKGARKDLSSSIDELKKPYFVMRDALHAVDRDIVYSLCQYGLGHVWEWGDEVGGQLWRTTGDIVDTWQSLYQIGFNQDVCAPYAKPGAWNDPDMMIVGWVGWGPNLHPTRLTPSEQYTHVSLWALQAAPLLIGCDISRLDDFTLSLLTNDEVIEVNQDALGKAALPLIKNEDYQVWVKELEDGSKALGIFNISPKDRVIKVDLKDLNINNSVNVRDIWRQKDLGLLKTVIENNVPAHGVYLVKLSK